MSLNKKITKEQLTDMVYGMAAELGAVKDSLNDIIVECESVMQDINELLSDTVGEEEED